MDDRFVLLKSNIVILEKKNNFIKADKQVLATVIKNITFLGYLFSEEMISVLETFSNDELIQFYNDLVLELKELLGIRRYNPLYPNFPKQVMEADDVEIYLNAILHYLSNGKIMPSYNIEDRVTLLDREDTRVLRVGSEKAIDSKFLNLLAAKTSLSNEDNVFIKWYINNKENIISILPDIIPLKENACLLVSEFSYNTNLRDEIANKYIKTTTDVLRLATAMSNGDISLKCNSKFRNFNRSERRFLLSLFEERLDEGELLKYVNRYKRLARVLHSNEYIDKYPKIAKAFNKLRSGEKIRTFNGLVEVKISEGKIREAVNLLKTRPGILVRRLDSLLRLNLDNDYVLEALEESIDKVESPVIIQCKNYFEHRNDNRILRSFFPKGQVSKIFITKNKLQSLDENLCNNIVDILNKALFDRYSLKESLGKVYVDDELKNYTVPFGQRSASKSLVTIARGSRIKMDYSKNTIRLFIYWREPEDDVVDIDLSCLICDENFRKIAEIAYYNLRERYSYHSGDIVEAPNGASEFIDVDIEELLIRTNYNGRYVLMNINSFSEESFKNLPECFAGWMLREFANSGEIYEPRTVVNKFDISSDSIFCIPMIFDLKKREAIWIDSSYSSKSHMPNNLHNNISGMELVCKAIFEKSYPNLYDLFIIHGKARGEIVDSINDADTVFSVNEGVRPTDIDIIVGEYL